MEPFTAKRFHNNPKVRNNYLDAQKVPSTEEGGIGNSVFNVPSMTVIVFFIVSVSPTPRPIYSLVSLNDYIPGIFQDIHVKSLVLALPSVATRSTSSYTRKQPTGNRTLRKNPQEYGYRCSFHLRVFQELLNPREREYDI